MHYKVPGLTSILIALAALILAAWRLFAVSLWLGAGFTLAAIAGGLIMLRTYCRKCPHLARGTCRHVLPGWIVGNLFHPRPPGPYSFRELLIAFFPVVMIMAFPQYWLFQHKAVFFAFWGLMAVAVVIVRMGVCPVCENGHCIMARSGIDRPTT